MSQQLQFSENDQRELGQVRKQKKKRKKKVLWTKLNRQFLEAEQAKARVQQTVHSLTDNCWVIESKRERRQIY